MLTWLCFLGLGFLGWLLGQHLVQVY
jgi:hypothetical protein